MATVSRVPVVGIVWQLTRIIIRGVDATYSLDYNNYVIPKDHLSIASIKSIDKHRPYGNISPPEYTIQNWFGKAINEACGERGDRGCAKYELY